jgi:hypothetical protein
MAFAALEFDAVSAERPESVVPSQSRPPRTNLPSRGLDRHLFQWTLLAALGVLAAMAWPFWRGEVYTMDDLGGFHLPTRALYAQELASGRIPHWTPALFGGFYLAGEGQVGVFHPLHLLLYRCLALRPAFCLEVLASYPFLLAGMYLLLRRHRCLRAASMFGALAFTFTGFNLLHFMHVNAVAVIAHIPWLLVAIDWLFAAPDNRRCLPPMLAIAMLTASQLLLGYPQFVWFSLLTEAAYLALRSFAAQPNGPRLPMARRQHSWPPHSQPARQAIVALPLARLFWFIAGISLGMLLGAVQLLPTLDVLNHSLREKITRDTLLAGSLHPWNLVQLVGPYLFRKRVVALNTHELGIYLGAAPLVLFAWLLGNYANFRRRPRVMLPLVCLAALALLLALGRWGGLYELQLLLPMVGHFRFPSRYVALFSLAMAVLAAIAYAELAKVAARRQSAPSTHRMSLAWPIALVLLSLLTALAAPWLWGAEHLGNPRQIATGPILFLSATLLVALAQRGRPWAIVGLGLLTAIDLGCYGLSYSVYGRAEPLDRFIARCHAPPGQPGDRVLADVYNARRLRADDQLVLAGFHRIDGYAGLEPRQTLRYRSLAALRVAAVRWVARLPETDTIPGLLPRGDNWFRVPDPLPSVRLVTQARKSADPARDLEAINLDTTALVDRDIRLAAAAPGTIESLARQAGQIRICVHGPSTQLLAVAESHHPGWQVRIDGLPARLERVNGDFFGCLVPPGAHEIVFAFRPASLFWGRLLSGAGFLAALGCGLIAFGPSAWTRVARPRAVGSSP